MASARVMSTLLKPNSIVMFQSNRLTPAGTTPGILIFTEKLSWLVKTCCDLVLDAQSLGSDRRFSRDLWMEPGNKNHQTVQL